MVKSVKGGVVRIEEEATNEGVYVTFVKRCLPLIMRRDRAGFLAEADAMGLSKASANQYKARLKAELKAEGRDLPDFARGRVGSAVTSSQLAAIFDSVASADK